MKQVTNKDKNGKICGKFISVKDKTPYPKTIVTAFDKHFVNVGPTLASAIPDQAVDFDIEMPSPNK